MHLEFWSLQGGSPDRSTCIKQQHQLRTHQRMLTMILLNFRATMLMELKPNPHSM